MRRAGEEICIGDKVRVQVLAVRGNQVKVGITAPGDMSIHRGEVAARIAAEKGAGVTGQLPLGGVQ